MAFHENLRILRLAKGLTQPALAEQAGIEQSYLSKLENGRSMPSDEVLKRIADALETTAEELMRNGADGEPVPRWRRPWAFAAGAALLLVAGAAGGWALRGAREAGQLGAPIGATAGMSVTERLYALAPPGVKLERVSVLPDGELYLDGRTVDRASVTDLLAALRRAGLGEAKSLRFTHGDSRFELNVMAAAGVSRADFNVQVELTKLGGEGIEVRSVIRRPEGGWYVAGSAPDAEAATEFMGRVERAGFGQATRRVVDAQGARTEFEFVAGAPE